MLYTSLSLALTPFVAHLGILHRALWILIFIVNTLSSVFSIFFTVECLNVTELRVTSKLAILFISTGWRARQCWWWYWSWWTLCFTITLLHNPSTHHQSQEINIDSGITLFHRPHLDFTDCSTVPSIGPGFYPGSHTVMTVQFPSVWSSSSAFLCI